MSVDALPPPEGGSKVPALVLGGGVTALGVLRSLAREGIPVLVGAERGDLIERSRWYRRPTGARPFRPGDDLADWLDTLEVERAVPIPCSDELALATAELPDHLVDRFPTFQPDARTLRRVVDKWAFFQVLRDQGIPCPVTHEVDDASDVDAIPWRPGRPLFVKPRDSHEFFGRFGVKGFMAEDRGQLRDHVEEASASGLGLMVQEYVPGPPFHHVFVDGFAREGGEIARFLIRRRLRMYPPRFGNSSCSETIPAADVAPAVDSLRRLLAALDFRGIFSAEFKLDADDGTFRILEINARPWWQVGFAERCGVNVAALAWRAALGLPVKPVAPDYPLGRRVVFPEYDVAACIHEHGRAAGWTRFLRDLPASHHPLLALDDPLPALSEWVREGSSRITRRISGRSKSARRPR